MDKNQPPLSLDITCSCDLMWNRDLLESGRRLSVKLDGVEQTRVVAYSMPGGWVRRHKLKDGKAFVEPGKDMVATENVRGKVEVSIVEK